MERLEQVMQQPTNRRAGFLDSMYARALQNESDVKYAQEVIAIIEQVQPSIRQKFQPHVEKLRAQVASVVAPEAIENTQIKTITIEDKSNIEQVQPSIRQKFQPHVEELRAQVASAVAPEAIENTQIKTIMIEGKSKNPIREDLTGVEVIFVYNATQFVPVRCYIEEQFPVGKKIRVEVSKNPFKSIREYGKDKAIIYNF